MTMQPARLDLHAIRIDAVAAAYGNADAPMKRLALLNLGARQPAYWTSATFSHAQAGILCEAANRLASLERAVGTQINEHPPARGAEAVTPTPTSPPPPPADSGPFRTNASAASREAGRPEPVKPGPL